MKSSAILAFCLLLVCLESQAQDDKTDREKKKDQQEKNSDQPLSNTAIGELAPFRAPKPGKYSMRPDNMPCVVPDVKEQASMPNAFRNATVIPYIPNRLPEKLQPKVKPEK